MTAYALLILQVLLTYGFDFHQLGPVLFFFSLYLFFGLIEILCRRSKVREEIDDIPAIHMAGFLTLFGTTAWLDYHNFAFVFVEMLFLCWFIFVWCLSPRSVEVQIRKQTSMLKFLVKFKILQIFFIKKKINAIPY